MCCTRVAKTRVSKGLVCFTRVAKTRVSKGLVCCTRVAKTWVSKGLVCCTRVAKTRVSKGLVCCTRVAKTRVSKGLVCCTRVAKTWVLNHGGHVDQASSSCTLTLHAYNMSNTHSYCTFKTCEPLAVCNATFHKIVSPPPPPPPLQCGSDEMIAVACGGWGGGRACEGWGGGQGVAITTVFLKS